MINTKAFKRIVTAAVVFAVIFVSLAGQVAATTGQKKIIAVYKGTGISFNGRPVMMRAAKDSTLKVYSYNNYDYVPIQAVSKHLRLTAAYSGKTNTITIKNSTSTAKNWMDGKRPGNTTPGAFGMRPRNGTPGAKPGQAPNNKNTSVKITSVKKTLTVTYKNIKVTYNGKTVALKDTKGKVLEPFIYSGDEYVPIKALSSALGLTFSYNTKTNIIDLTKKK